MDKRKGNGVSDTIKASLQEVSIREKLNLSRAGTKFLGGMEIHEAHIGAVLTTPSRWPMSIATSARRNISPLDRASRAVAALNR
jgi:hypothetical protein